MALQQTGVGGIQQRDTSVLANPQLVSFDISYKQLIERWEDPHYSGKITTDGGGETRYGISQHAYPSLDIATITLTRAQEITHADYWMYSKWDISKILSTKQDLANKLFQFGFNVGVGTVIQIANMSLAVLQNRKILPKLGDPLSVSQLPDAQAYILLQMLAASQMSRYIVDYHGLSRVPHSLMDRALCTE